MLIFINCCHNKPPNLLSEPIRYIILTPHIINQIQNGLADLKNFSIKRFQDDTVLYLR